MKHLILAFKQLVLQKIDFWIVLLGSAIVGYLLAGLLVPGGELFIKGYESHSYLIQSLLFHESFEQGNWFANWETSLMSGFGYPLFLFSGKGVFLGVELLHQITGDFVKSWQLYLWSINFGSFIGAYFLLRLYADKVPAFCGALVFLFFPYHTAEIFVKMDVSELSGSFFWGVWSFYFLAQFIKSEKTQYLAFGALSIAGLICTHVLSAVMLLPVLILFVGLSLYTEKKFIKLIFWCILGAIVSFGISSFYLFPWLFEGGLLQNSNLEGTNYTPEKYIDKDILSLKYFDIDQITIGAFNYTKIYPLSLGILSIFVGGFLFLFSKGQERKNKLMLGFWLIIAAIALFMVGFSESKIIWEKVASWNLFKSAWSLLVLVAFAAAFAATFVAQEFTKNKHYSRIMVIGFFATLLWMANMPYLEGTNWNNWEKYPSQTRDGDYNRSYFKVEVEQFKIDRHPGFGGDEKSVYRPQTVSSSLIHEIDNGRKANYALLYSFVGQGVVVSEFWKNGTEFFYKATSPVEQAVSMDQLYFPGWRVLVNQQPVSAFPNDQGLLSFQVPAGEVEVQIQFLNSGARALGNLVSQISLGVFFLLLLGAVGNRLPNILRKRKAVKKNKK